MLLPTVPVWESKFHWDDLFHLLECINQYGIHMAKFFRHSVFDPISPVLISGQTILYGSRRRHSSYRCTIVIYHLGQSPYGERILGEELVWWLGDLRGCVIKIQDGKLPFSLPSSSIRLRFLYARKRQRTHKGLVYVYSSHETLLLLLLICVPSTTV